MSPCSDERPGDREHERHMREGAALLCAIMRHDLTIYDQSVMVWWERHQRFDANYADHGHYADEP